MARRKAAAEPPEDPYLVASMQEIIGATYLRDLPALDIVALTKTFGPAVHPGDDKRYGPTWAAKDPEGNVWSIYTRQGTWQLSGRGLHYPSKPLLSTTNRFAQYLVATCKEKRSC